jgi:ribose transport system substrate-binding protein/inositol transport system substrate-binding protein
MKMLNVTALIAGAVGVALAAGPLQAAEQKPLTVIASSPNMAFPFFIHMMKQIQAEADKLGNIKVVVTDGQNQTPKQTADVEAAITQGVDGIIISPNDVDAMAPAIQEAIDAGIPVVTIDRRVDKVPGILGHVGADNVKGGEAQGELVLKLFPNGATVMNLQGVPGSSPAIDRNKGLHNVLDKVKDKYKIVFEDTASFTREKGLSVTESALGGMATPPDVIVAANDDMALGAIEALKARNIIDKVKVIGFDALPEALAQIRDGTLTASIEQLPGGQSRGAVDLLVAFLRDGKKPAQQITLLTPIAITKDNLDQAERLGEVK